MASDVVCAAAGNHQLSVQVAELQEALQKQEAFTELVIAELRRLSVLAGEPPQLPAFSPGTLQVGVHTHTNALLNSASS